MLSRMRHPGVRRSLEAVALAVGLASMTDSSALAQNGMMPAPGNPMANTTQGGGNYYPYYGRRGVAPGYNIYGNYGVYGYPGSGVEGGASNPGYDPGYGGYPSYGGYGIANRGNAAPAPNRRLLGIDEEPIVISGGTKAMKVSKVYPGTAAEQAGLQAGDVIRSANGFLTEQRGNLAWIIATKTPTNDLNLTIQAAKDGQTRVIKATLR